jgi:RimJ/RimL family protein N-acetyltransferase
MSHEQFDIFVREMLTDPRVVEHYHSYRGLFDLQQIRSRAEKDFWEHFEESRANTDFEIWSIIEKPADSSAGSFVGWAGLLHSSLSDQYDGPELQFMIASRAFGQGYATEAAAKVLDDARERELAPKVIATVDIPNAGSIRVLEKLEFEFIEQIESYGSAEMYLYTKQMN